MGIPWIKIRTNLASDPTIGQLADLLRCTDDTALGLCVKFWAWADGVTCDGRLGAVTTRRLDRLVGRRGFADAMLLVGWLCDDQGELVIPRFERHNGDSAKRRLTDAERKAQGYAAEKARSPPPAGLRPDPDQPRFQRSDKRSIDDLVGEVANKRGMA